MQRPPLAPLLALLGLLLIVSMGTGAVALAHPTHSGRPHVRRRHKPGRRHRGRISSTRHPATTASRAAVPQVSVPTGSVPAGTAPSPSAATTAPEFFATDSVWNTALAPDQPVDPASPAYAGEVWRQVQTYGTGVMTTDSGVPIYTVPSSQPLVHVTLDSQSSPLLAQAFNAVPVPLDAQPAAGLDANLAVWQPSTDTLWEFWHFRSAADGFHAGYGGRMLNVSSSPGNYMDILGPGGTYVERSWWGTTAAKFSLVAGVITLQDLARGEIDHALCLSLPQVRSGVFALPAQATDGTYSGPNAIPEGAHLRLNPSLNLDALHLAPIVLMIARAAQRYGIIVVNTGGGVGFRGEDPTGAESNPWPALLGSTPGLLLKTEFPWSQLQMLPMTLANG